MSKASLPINVSDRESSNLENASILLNRISTTLNRLNSHTEIPLQCEPSRKKERNHNEKSFWETTNLGEQTSMDEKKTYVKAVFHITRVNKKTQSQVRINKHRHVISHWEHVGSQYYARGMCKKWYFSVGKRNKNAYKCKHENRSHYAKGLCKLCYLKSYHQTHDRKK